MGYPVAHRWIATPPHRRAMGFKPGSGTRDAVATLIHNISEAKHRSAHKQKGVAVYWTLRKHLKWYIGTLSSMS